MDTREQVVNVTTGNATQSPQRYTVIGSTYRELLAGLTEAGLPAGIFYLPNLNSPSGWKVVVDLDRNVEPEIYYGIDNPTLDMAKSLFHSIYYPDQVSKLLAAGADPNIPDLDGDYPLHRCVDVEAIKILLKGGADINVVDRNGRTPLFNAISIQNWDLRLEIISILLNNGADPNIPDKDGNYPLHYAIKSDRDVELTMLLKAGADPSVADKDGDTPLILALWKNQFYNVNKILELGVVDTPNKQGQTAQSIARMKGIGMFADKIRDSTGIDIKEPDV